ncbi:MAG: hypothetical protein ACO1N1_10225 [Dyadobacter fermentans]
MQLTISKIFPAPLSIYVRFTYALESIGAFLTGDGDKVILVRPNGSIELIATLGEDEYQWEGIGADFFREISQKRLGGFGILSLDEQAGFTQSAIYKSTRERPFARYGHDKALLFFSGKSIALLKWENGQLVELKRTRTKGRDPIRWALHPEQNTLLYGTNHGELYSQTFTADRFVRCVKVDQLPNTCHQITFTPDGRQLFVAGMGFIKSYEFDGTGFTASLSTETAVRSFEFVEDYLVLNKGMHGIDVLQIKDKLERVTSLDLPFSIDKMYYLAPQKTFLLISGSTNEWALLSWTA